MSFSVGCEGRIIVEVQRREGQPHFVHINIASIKVRLTPNQASKLGAALKRAAITGSVDETSEEPADAEQPARRPA